MKLDVCKKIIAEWLEEQVLPAAIRREAGPMDLENLSEILAIVGPRRAGKTFFMYQLIRDLWDRSAKRKIFSDLISYRLENFGRKTSKQLLAHQLTVSAVIFSMKSNASPAEPGPPPSVQRRYRIVISAATPSF
jgi:predicted AAA+ superfamily ATPase